MIAEASIILPVKNEPYLPTLLEQINQQGKYKEILIQTENGLSQAILAGIQKSKGKIICVLDADGSHSPTYLNSMIALLKDYDIVIGSRYIEGGSTEDKISRRFISRVYRYVANKLFNLPIKDVLSGYIVAKKEIFTTLQLNPIGYKWGLELLVKSQKSQNTYKVIEYPIRFTQRKQGSSKADLKQGLQTLYFMFKLYMEKQNHA